MGYCRDCVYFKRDANLDDYGMKHNECHRYPKSAENKCYPEVYLFDWCGEFKSKIDVVKKPPKPREPVPDNIGIFGGWENEC